MSWFYWLVVGCKCTRICYYKGTIEATAKKKYCFSPSALFVICILIYSCFIDFDTITLPDSLFVPNPIIETQFVTLV